MTVSTHPAWPLPLGADPDNSEDWQEATPTEPAYRCVWTPAAAGPETDIRGVVVQWGDGTIATEGDDAPLVYINASCYQPDEAREIADAIRTVADQVDRWAGRSPELDRLVRMRALVMETYNALTVKSGDGADCLRATIDGFDDMIAAMRAAAS
ncbi:hypothetical protein VST63_25505 [Mycolicibacterium sp. 050232]|uniref:hypothetical protein n=1 Tax=Mycolicibacterium sp. 050232 TaxID=3113982 RepID=UPI002E27F42E|nr:hypothetical protein [Mycolicibacterium sp. 050232]MED5815730.1 hypothetical protein [Mycolicibacterium sp. 050232]